MRPNKVIPVWGGKKKTQHSMWHMVSLLQVVAVGILTNFIVRKTWVCIPARATVCWTSQAGVVRSHPTSLSLGSFICKVETIITPGSSS